MYGLTLNGLVSAFPEMPGCCFGQFVPYRREFVRIGVSRAEVSGFAYSNVGGEEVRVPNIYIRKKWAIYNKGLVERLPSGVH